MTSKIQISILRALSLESSLRFAQINKDNVPSDQFSYHLRQLQKMGLIDKQSDNTYRLTDIGKQHILNFDRNIETYIERGLIAALAVITRGSGKDEEVLLSRRNRQPDYGRLTLVGGQVAFGESIHDAIKESVYIETGVKADFKLLGMKHILTNRDGVQQDLYFFVYLAQNFHDTINSAPRREHVWKKVSELESLDTLEGLKEMIAMRNNLDVSISEIGTSF